MKGDCSYIVRMSHPALDLNVAPSKSLGRAMQRPLWARRVKWFFNPFETERFVTAEQQRQIHDAKHDGVTFLRNGLLALEKVAEALDDAGIEWWISYGTLLGWRRGNALISHDVDIDINLAPGTSSAAVNSALASAGMRPTIRVRYRGQVSNENYWGHRTYLDFFYVFEEKGVSFVRSRKKKCCFDLSEPKANRVRADFQGVQVWVPEDADTYLQHLYGPQWRVPDPDWDWLLGTNIYAVHGNPFERLRCWFIARQMRRRHEKRIVATA